jgi:uncharacterized repeat protein (TIGR01451 family)
LDGNADGKRTSFKTGRKPDDEYQTERNPDLQEKGGNHMNLRWMQAVLLGILVISLPLQAWGDEKPKLVLRITAQKEVLVKDKDGKTRVEWTEAGKTDPGDVLKFTITYTNAGATEARSAVISNPVPEGTAYVGGSAEGKDTVIDFSLDGKNYEAPPMIKYKIKQADGKEAEYQATPDMYKHIRWRMARPAPPNTSGTVSFKVTVK